MLVPCYQCPAVFDTVPARESHVRDRHPHPWVNQRVTGGCAPSLWGLGAFPYSLRGRRPMPHIVKRISLEEIKAAKPATIYYGVNTCWWTHRAEDLRTLPPREPGRSGLPCDPRGGVLMMGDAMDFLANAESQPEHYGRYGMAAFMAAHNDNCVVSVEDHRSTCLRTWAEYNELITLGLAAGTL